MTDTLIQWLALGLAAWGAGALNAVAGGGSFLTFPALVWAGVPPIAANATSAFAVMPGYAGSVLGFKAELAALPRATLAREMLISAGGGVAGALLLLITPAQVFASVVPWLLLLATLLFALGPRIAQWARRGAAASADERLGGQGLGRQAGLLLVAVYGGYFNGGLGILLMALYLLAGVRHVHTANALKNLNSLVLSALSVGAFALGGLIVWPQALWMAALATVGGLVGARLSRRLPAQAVRLIVIATGVLMTAVFFARQYGA